MNSRYRRGSGTTAAETFTAVDATNKGGSVEMLNSAQSWINDTNRVWSGITIRRYNKGIVRWPSGWTSRVISFQAVNTPQVDANDPFAVVVDGALAASVTVAADSVPHRYNAVIPAATTSVEVWEPFQGRAAPVNNDADGQIEAGFVTGVYGTSITKPTATTCIVTVGDSILSGCNTNPAIFYGVVGQLRLLAHPLGRLVVSLDCGATTLCGDGYTGANLATLIQQAAASTGATTVYVLFQYGRNDYSYYGATASHTPTNVQTALQACITALPAAYIKVVSTPIPQATETANGGGFTLPNYRTAEAAVTGTNLTILAGTSYGIVAGTDLYDGVHLNVGGVAKNLAGVKTALGL